MRSYQLLQLLAVFNLFRLEPLNETRTPSPQAERQNDTHHHDKMLWFQHDVCTIRYSFRSITRNFLSCARVKELNPICGRDITVVFSSKPPYAMEVKNASTGFGTGEYKGILFGILEETIVKTCCVGCNKLKIMPPVGFREKFNDREQYDLILPIEGGEKNKMFFSTPYFPIIQQKAIAFIGKRPEKPNVDLIDLVFDTVWSSWSLVLLGLTMALSAGSAIWVLDTWYNKPQFPRSFPRGPFEGFWWAYVSMTTVGYGDRTPSSVAARLFAIGWILIGIAYFNVFTSMFTSVLSERMGTNAKFSVFGEKVGILENASAPFVGASENMAFIQVYSNLSSLAFALRDNEIHAIAMVEMVALFYLDYFKRIADDVDIQSRTEITGSTLGIITTNKDLYGIISSFFNANEESLEAINTRAVMSQVDDLGIFIKKKTTVRSSTSLFISETKVLYGCLMFGGATIGLCILGWFLNYGNKHRKLARNRATEKRLNNNNARQPPPKWIGFNINQYKES